MPVMAAAERASAMAAAAGEVVTDDATSAERLRRISSRPVGGHRRIEPPGGFEADAASALAAAAGVRVMDGNVEVSAHGDDMAADVALSDDDDDDDDEEEDSRVEEAFGSGEGEADEGTSDDEGVDEAKGDEDDSGGGEEGGGAAASSSSDAGALRQAGGGSRGARATKKRATGEGQTSAKGRVARALGERAGKQLPPSVFGHVGARGDGGDGRMVSAVAKSKSSRLRALLAQEIACQSAVSASLAGA